MSSKQSVLLVPTLPTLADIGNVCVSGMPPLAFCDHDAKFAFALVVLCEAQVGDLLPK